MQEFAALHKTSAPAQLFGLLFYLAWTRKKRLGCFSTAAKNTASLAQERTRMAGCLQGRKVKPGGNFEFSGMVTESLLLGTLAVRTGQKLAWDRANLKAINSEAAQKMVARERRKGWDL
jgi:hypothetical protein